MGELTQSSLAQELVVDAGRYALAITLPMSPAVAVLYECRAVGKIEMTRARYERNVQEEYRFVSLSSHASIDSAARASLILTDSSSVAGGSVRIAARMVSVRCSSVH